jgi:hypothetical protein
VALGLKKESVFFKTCARARREKKPVLVCVVQNPDDESQIDMMVRIFAEAPMV